MRILNIDMLVQTWSGYVMNIKMTRKTRLSKSKLSWSTLRCVHKIMKAQIMSLTPVSTRGCQFTNELNVDKRLQISKSEKSFMDLWIARLICMREVAWWKPPRVICYLSLYDILASSHFLLIIFFCEYESTCHF